MITVCLIKLAGNSSRPNDFNPVDGSGCWAASRFIPTQHYHHALIRLVELSSGLDLFFFSFSFEYRGLLSDTGIDAAELHRGLLSSITQGIT